MELIKHYFREFNSDQLAKYRELGALYEEWNAKINVISRKDMAAFYERHVLHSLAPLKLNVISENKRVLDMGTGGGFPGIPLAIAFPRVNFNLIDSIAKKIKVVQSVSEALDLSNVKAQQARVEELDDHYDIIVCRAVAQTVQLLDWTANKLKKNGQYLLLKGGNLSNELDEARAAYPNCRIISYPLNKWFKEEFFATKQLVHIQFQ